jgi:hypothetical protein
MTVASFIASQRTERGFPRGVLSGAEAAPQDRAA